MVCNRCISTVKNELENIGLHPTEISLGEVSFAATEIAALPLIQERLKPLGFSLVEDKRVKLVKDVKMLVEKVYSGDFDFPVRFRFSALAAESLQKDYDAISTIFSSVENITVEKHIIDFRIEKIKEFLVYTPQTLADIAFRLGFSSVAHLSRQFKIVTGFNPSHFKAIRDDKQRIRSQSAE